MEPEDNDGSDRNGDGQEDQAGFSAIAISSDGTRGIEDNRTWAQADGTTQDNADRN